MKYDESTDLILLKAETGGSLRSRSALPQDKKRLKVGAQPVPIDQGARLK